MPAVWIEVEGHPKPFQSPPAWRTDVHGRFQIDDIPPGPVKLLVSMGRGPRQVPNKVVETRTGTRDLAIVLDPGAQLLLRIVDYVPGPEERGARLTWGDPHGDMLWSPIRDDGWVRFVGLPPDGEFDLWATAEIKRRYVGAQGLRPGQGEQRIERQEVKDIAGQVRASKAFRKKLAKAVFGRTLSDWLSVKIYAPTPAGVALGYSITRASLEPDGSFRVRGLPPGTYVVNVGSGSGWVFSKSKLVEAGTTDVVFNFD